MQQYWVSTVGAVEVEVLGRPRYISAREPEAVVRLPSREGVPHGNDCHGGPLLLQRLRCLDASPLPDLYERTVK